MRIQSVHPSLSFGQSENKSKSSIVPMTLAGAAVGAGTAHFTRIKADPGNLDTFISTVGEKLPMSSDTKETFNSFKTHYENVKKSADEAQIKRLQKLGLTGETELVTKEDVYKKIVHPNTSDKNMKGLDAEIKYINGELQGYDNALAAAETPEAKAEIAKKKADSTAALKEKKDVKGIIEQSKDANVTRKNVADYFDSAVKNEPKINLHTNEFSKLTKSFNRHRVGIFTAIGAAAGLTAAYLSRKDKA